VAIRSRPRRRAIRIADLTDARHVASPTPQLMG
jgi:hypothetical protein